MNLSKLFEIQAGLDYHINKEKGLEGQDLLPKKILALQVELGELANEWRGFKFWSNDQEPRTKIVCIACHGVGEVLEQIDGYYFDCPHCDGSGLEEQTNPLLEEYVDCLHFILSIGNDTGFNSFDSIEEWCQEKETIEFFNEIFSDTGTLRKSLESRYLTANGLSIAKTNMATYLRKFLKLGELLGFTTEQIEQSYLEKNRINHERQINGY